MTEESSKLDKSSKYIVVTYFLLALQIAGFWFKGLLPIKPKFINLFDFLYFITVIFNSISLYFIGLRSDLKTQDEINTNENTIGGLSITGLIIFLGLSLLLK